MINVIKVDDFEKFTEKLEEIATALENMPTPTGGGIDYSMTEQDTGLKWVDGKNIYQKTIYVTTAGGVSNINHDIVDIDKCISITGTCLYQGTTQLILPYVSISSDYNICLGNVTSTTFMIQTGGSISVTDIYVTIQYTKQ